MTAPSDTNLFRRHPAAALVLIVGVLSLVLDLALTSVYNLVKHGTIHHRVNKPSPIRAASPVFHHTLKPDTISDAEAWGPLHPTLVTNSLGIKDRSARTVSPRPEHHRIVFMGDSFTEGVGYDYPHTFVGLIDEALGPGGIEVLNAGVVGYSPAVYYKKTEYLLNTVGLVFDAMVVCLDVSDPIDEIKNYTIRGDETILTPDLPSPVTEFFSNYSTIPRHLIKLVRLADEMVRDSEFRMTEPIVQTAEDKRYGTRQERSLWTIDRPLYEALGRRGQARAERHMNLLHSLLSNRRIPLILVVYPWPDQIAHHDLDSIHVKFWRDWAAARSVPFVNLFPGFIDDSRPPYDTIAAFYIPGDTHWNDAGHRLVARYILKELSPLVSGWKPDAAKKVPHRQTSRPHTSRPHISR